ncbi:MAG: type II toxin-antitoxin system VapC family toxin [Spirochaetaceae bacterium]|nr:type II toxin-antitoxin system VapC family toxin [Spirochaetaceae bacterium]
MVAYLDSSVMLRYILLGETVLRHVQAFPRLASSELLEIECRRVLLRCRIEGELNDETLVEATSRLDDALKGVDLLEIDSSVKKRAMEAFPIHVKTLDALHLASALQLLAEEPADGITVFSHDRAFNLCARALGFNAALL